MFSDHCILPCDIPPFDAQPHEDPLAPLDFDDLLDIAHEFEFTRTITHIWPCEEPTPCSETGLDDILAGIMPASSAKECLLPLPSSALPIPLERVHLEEVDVQRSVSVHPVADENASISTASVPLPNDDDQLRSEGGCPITSILRGWFPPNGSQFLDLDDSLMLPQSATDAWLSPWLTPFLTPSYTQSINQSSVTVQAIDDLPPATESKAQPISIIDMAVDSPRRDTVPFVAPPAPRANPEPGQARPTLPANSNMQRQTVPTPHTKTTKYRQLPSAPAMGGPSAAKYTKAPRGGIPPHIARTVTKANFLRMEKERKVMQDAFSSTNTGEGKEPSVLRRVVRAENMGAEGRGKNPFDLRGNNEKKGRATKRVKV